MRIKEILSQSRRDFTAIYECDHCGKTHESVGYDESYFHEVVIPSMECSGCGKTAKDTYRPLATKYQDNQVV